ncbi:MAG: hypothetical protein U0872_02835 [Planctomycetaceae bacterium]
MAPQSPQRSMMKRRFLARWLVVTWLCSLGIVRGADPSPQTDFGVLYLANGGFVAGKLADALPPMNGALDWQGTEFASPFRFPLGAVQAMVFPRAAKPEHAPETICFELVGGDVLFGSLKRIDADRIEIAESTLGDVTIRRDYLRRFYRKTRNHARIYAGPVNLAQWSQGPEQSLWREEAGRFLTDQAGAWLRKNVPLPAQAEIEIELSWTKPPNFVVAMGTCAQDDAELKAFRLEVVGTDLVAVRETNREADLAVITPLGPDEGHIHLTIYLDQPRGRLLVDTMSGTSLANLEIPNEQSAVGPCLTLLNLRGDLSLQRLRISHWNGVAPTSNAHGETRFQPSTGQLQKGRLTGFDEGDQTLTFRVGEEEVHVPLDQLDDVQLEPANEAHQPTSELSTIQISYHDGTCITGVWLGTDGQQIALLPRGTLSAVCAPDRSARVSFLQTRSTLGNLVKRRPDWNWRKHVCLDGWSMVMNGLTRVA